MAVLTTQVERESEQFARRRERMEALVAELRERAAEVTRGGGEQATERHRSRGKLTARERVDRLVDPGSAFLELNALAAWDMYERSAPAASDRVTRRRTSSCRAPTADRSASAICAGARFSSTSDPLPDR